MAETEAKGPPSLVRGLGAWDGTLITIGSVLGSAIFIAAADVVRAVPHAGLVLLLWALGGLLTVAGALTYAELGGMFPKAGGQYHFLKEAYGPFWGFLFGWASFLIIMSGGLAALAAGFGEYLGSFLPFFSTGERPVHRAARPVAVGRERRPARGSPGPGLPDRDQLLRREAGRRLPERDHAAQGRQHRRPGRGGPRWSPRGPAPISSRRCRKATFWRRWASG